MTLLLRDSIDAPLIPADTPVVAGYGDGRYIWSPSWMDGSNWWDLFPNSVQLVIVVSAAHQGDVLDVEQGDATPAQAPSWIAQFARPARRAGTIYCNRDTWPAVIAELQASGIDPAGPRVDWWIGTLDGTRQVTIPPGGKAPAAVQYIDTGAYDESIIYDPSWVGKGEQDMPLTQGLKIGLAHVTFYALYGRGPSEQELFDLANTIADDGSNFGDLVQGLTANLGNPDVVRLQATTLASEVDALKAAPPAAAVPPHTHPVTVSGTSGTP